MPEERHSGLTGLARCRYMPYFLAVALGDAHRNGYPRCFVAGFVCYRLVAVMIALLAVADQFALAAGFGHKRDPHRHGQVWSGQAQRGFRAEDT